MIMAYMIFPLAELGFGKDEDIIQYVPLQGKSAREREEGT
jgi:hypothetical protein